jgi:hypothetical protein
VAIVISASDSLYFRWFAALDASWDAPGTNLGDSVACAGIFGKAAHHPISFDLQKMHTALNFMAVSEFAVQR